MNRKLLRTEQSSAPLIAGDQLSATVEIALISALRPYPRNARIHSTSQIRQLMASISEFGWIVPIIVDAGLNVICGHGRLQAAKRLGMKEVPVIRADHLTEAQVRAYRLADNKIAQNATWDDELIRIELNDIADLDVSFDLELTGFDAGEIDIILQDGEQTEAENVPGPDRDTPATCREGELWIVGPHRLFCGDCRSVTSWRTLLASNLAQMVFTDPPYNVRIVGNVSGLGGTAHREFAMASGEMSKAEYTSFLRTVFVLLVEHSCETAIHYVCMDWRHMREVLDASDGVYNELKNACVWAKTNAGTRAKPRPRSATPRTSCSPAKTRTPIGAILMSSSLCWR